MATEKLSWDSALNETEAVEQQKENDFILLPEGEYNFTVKKFEKGQYVAKPNAQIPSCPVAQLQLLVKTDDGDAAYFRENLFLHSGNKWQLYQFFTCLGLRKHGDGSTDMPWDSVEGATGRALIGKRKYKSKDGEEKTTNTVKKWLDPAPESTGGDGEPGEDDYE